MFAPVRGAAAAFAVALLSSAAPTASWAMPIGDPQSSTQAPAVVRSIAALPTPAPCDAPNPPPSCPSSADPTPPSPPTQPDPPANPAPPANPGPPVTSPDPPVTNPDPPAISPDPPVTSPDPSVTDPTLPSEPTPPITNPDPPVTDPTLPSEPTPPITNPDPPVTNPDPPVDNTAPPVGAAAPALAPAPLLTQPVNTPVTPDTPGHPPQDDHPPQNNHPPSGDYSGQPDHPVHPDHPSDHPSNNHPSNNHPSNNPSDSHDGDNNGKGDHGDNSHGDDHHNHDNNHSCDDEDRTARHSDDCDFVIDRTTIKLGGCREFSDATGKVVFEERRFQRDVFRVKVKDLALPDGTELTIRIDGRLAGTFELGDQAGTFTRRSNHLPSFEQLGGDEHPTISQGDGDTREVVMSHACAKDNGDD